MIVKVVVVIVVVVVVGDTRRKRGMDEWNEVAIIQKSEVYIKKERNPFQSGKFSDIDSFRFF